MRQRGSAILFVVAIVAAITTVWIAVSNLAWQVGLDESHREANVQAKETLSGAIDQLRVDYLLGNVTLPATRTTMLGTGTCNMTVTDNSASMAKSMLVTAVTTVGQRSYTASKVVTTPLQPNALYYALMSNTALTSSKDVISGSAGKNGDIECNSNLNLTSATNVINGDYEATGTATVNGYSSAMRWTGAPAIPFPTPNSVNYLANESSVVLGSLHSYDFTSTPYALLYNALGLDINGSFKGIGTVFVWGNVNVSNDITYATAGSRVGFVVVGNMTVAASAKNLAGYFYVTGTVTFTGATARTLTRGSLAAGTFSLPCPLTVTYDPTLYNTPSEGTNMKLPGFWP